MASVHLPSSSHVVLHGLSPYSQLQKFLILPCEMVASSIVGSSMLDFNDNALCLRSLELCNNNRQNSKLKFREETAECC